MYIYTIYNILCTGMWASQIRVVDMGIGGGQPNTLFKVPLEQNEAAVSVCIVWWASHVGHVHPHLVVGVAKDMILSPRSCSEGSLHVYKVSYPIFFYILFSTCAYLFFIIFS